MTQRILPNKISNELELDSIAFWGEPIRIKNQPFNSIRRYQLLIQLKKQFKINPRECWARTRKNPNTYHDSPEECGMHFYVETFGNTDYFPDGKVRP